MSNDLTMIPVLWAVRYPKTGGLLMDESEDFIRRWSAAIPGSTVLRLDVPALLRVAWAAREAREWQLDAAQAGDDVWRAATVAQAALEAVAALDAALAALDTTAPTG